MRTKPLALLAAAATTVSLFVAAPADAAPARPAVQVVTAAKAASTIKLKRTSTATPVAADWITLTGTASKALAGARLTVQRKESGKGWGSVGTAKVSKAGTFGIRTRANGVGGFSYKVSSAKTKKIATVTSNTVGVTVFKWYYLSDLSYVDSVATWGVDRGTVTMGGHPYYQSRIMSGKNKNTFWVDFNASRRCNAFEATVGVGDSAATGASIHHSVLLDGTEVLAADTPLGTTQSVSTDVTGVFRLRLQDSYTDPHGNGAAAGWGNARMLCSGQP